MHPDTMIGINEDNQIIQNTFLSSSEECPEYITTISEDIDAIKIRSKL